MMTALNDPGHPDDQDEDCFENPPVPRTVPEDPSDDDDWGDSDDDEERGGVDGYQLLPQDLPQRLEQEPGGTEELDDEIREEDSTFPDLSTFNPNSESFEAEARRNWISEEARERVEIFSSSNEAETSRREIDLNKDKISAIQSAMAKISLPPAAVPVWADKLSDDDWNQLIRDRFGAHQKAEQNLPGKSVSLQNTEKASTSHD